MFQSYIWHIIWIRVCRDSYILGYTLYTCLYRYIYISNQSNSQITDLHITMFYVHTWNRIQLDALREYVQRNCSDSLACGGGWQHQGEPYDVARLHMVPPWFSHNMYICKSDRCARRPPFPSTSNIKSNLIFVKSSKQLFRISTILNRHNDSHLVITLFKSFPHHPCISSM